MQVNHIIQKEYDLHGCLPTLMLIIPTDLGADKPMSS
jgi:hypothetical protein